MTVAICSIRLSPTPHGRRSRQLRHESVIGLGAFAFAFGFRDLDSNERGAADALLENVARGCVARKV
jgi:hypothetical protein